MLFRSHSRASFSYASVAGFAKWSTSYAAYVCALHSLRVSPNSPHVIQGDEGERESRNIGAVRRDGRVADLLVEQVNLTAIGTESQMAKMREYLGSAAADAAWKWTVHPPTTGGDVDEEYWAVTSESEQHGNPIKMAH